jgi:hypothetical protein
MKKIILILSVSLILLLPFVSYCELEQEEKVACFHNGNSYMKLEGVARAYYLQGLIDGMSYMRTDLWSMSEEHSFGFPLEIVLAMESADRFAEKNMDIFQIVTIFNKFLEECPERWHYAVSYLFIDCIIKFELW